MRILPVLDLKAGQVVHGIAGRRQEYRPIVSRLTASCHPVDVAKAFLEHFGFGELYVADLDAIGGVPPTLPTYAAILSLGVRLWIDAGIRDLTMARPLADLGVDSIVIGLESVTGPEELARICAELGSRRTVFSLDLKEGKPLGDTSKWKEVDAFSIALQAIDLGVERVIVLDVARVGMNAGLGTEEICKRLILAYPRVEFLTGGGVRNMADLRRLKRLGVRAALVASALHDGRITPADLAVL
jgi:phosphoribosylformimino-5-aminoimidazole carboxamide ribotide isomerase